MTTLNKLKNVLAGQTPALPAEPPSPSPDADTITAQVRKKQKELAQWKTAAQVERLRADLDAAQIALAHAENAEGECLVDERDTTAASEARHQASDRVRMLASAVTIARQKDGAALAELEQAERQVEIEAKDAARERLLALAQEGEEIFARIKLLRADLMRETVAAYTAGGVESWGARESVDYFDFFLKRANRSAAAAAADSGAFMKYPNWTTCLQYVCGKIQP
jgi:hypothetical protein